MQALIRGQMALRNLLLSLALALRALLGSPLREAGSPLRKAMRFFAGAAMALLLRRGRRALLLLRRALVFRRALLRRALGVLLRLVLRALRFFLRLFLLVLQNLLVLVVGIPCRGGRGRVGCALVGPDMVG